LATTSKTLAWFFFFIIAPSLLERDQLTNHAPFATGGTGHPSGWFRAARALMSRPTYPPSVQRPCLTLGGVPREPKMPKGNLPRVIYHRVYWSTRRLINLGPPPLQTFYDASPAWRAASSCSRSPRPLSWSNPGNSIFLSESGSENYDPKAFTITSQSE